MTDHCLVNSLLLHQPSSAANIKHELFANILFRFLWASCTPVLEQAMDHHLHEAELNWRSCEGIWIPPAVLQVSREGSARPGCVSAGHNQQGLVASWCCVPWQGTEGHEAVPWLPACSFQPLAGLGSVRWGWSSSTASSLPPWGSH